MSDKKVILFGCGTYGKKALEKIGKHKVECFADNDYAKVGSNVEEKRVISYDEMIQNKLHYEIVLAASDTFVAEMMKQLISDKIFDFILYEELDKYIEGKLDFEEIYTKHLIRLMEITEKCKVDIEKRYAFLKEHVSVNEVHPAVGYKRAKQLELVKFASDFFSDIAYLNIHPFLTCGNLLGLIRHDGFIPWDDDMDFGLMRKDYEMLLDEWRKRGRLFFYDGEILDAEEEAKWVDGLLREYRNEYFLAIYPEHLQLNYGTSYLNRKSIDFFCFDSYCDDYSFERHMQLVFKMNHEIEQIKKAKEKWKIIKKYMDLESKYIDEHGRNIYFGLDSCLTQMRRNSEWIERNTVFPLKSTIYEGLVFEIPHREKEYIRYEYKNEMEFPDDFGVDTHDYQREYICKKYVTAEFYLTDTLEIMHFEPIYQMLREKEVYAIFVVEPIDRNTGGRQFDYKTAKKILDEHNLEFSEYVNENADVAFTTQDVKVLKKYKKAKKINLTYGESFNENR